MCVNIFSKIYTSLVKSENSMAVNYTNFFPRKICKDSLLILGLLLLFYVTFLMKFHLVELLQLKQNKVGFSNVHLNSDNIVTELDFFFWW